MIRRIALDTNLLVLWIIGAVERDQIGKHKRLRSYAIADFDLLIDYLSEKEVVLTPNALTEVSNLARQGFSEPRKTDIAKEIAALVFTHGEVFIPSRQAVAIPEYSRLGLADSVWLEIADMETEILTVDAKLYIAALERALPSTNFNHLRG